MNKQDVLKTIIEITKDHLDYTEKKAPNIRLDSNIENISQEMGGDSLDIIEIILKIEKHYGISISDDQIKNNLKTFDDLCNIIIQQKQKTFAYRIKRFFQKTK